LAALAGLPVAVFLARLPFLKAGFVSCSLVNASRFGGELTPFLSLPDPMHKVALLGLGKVFMIPG